MSVDLEDKKQYNKVLKKGALYGALFVVIILIVLYLILALITGKADALGIKEFIKLKQAEVIVNQNYRGDLDKENLQDYLMAGYVAGLSDPYANYYGKEQLKEYNSGVDGKYVGLGFTYSKDTKSGNIKISSVYKNTPAEKAGLKSGDYITKIGDKEISSLKNDILKGYKKGDKVKITYYSKNPKELKIIEVILTDINVTSVEDKVITSGKNKIGYIKVNEFNANTDEQWTKALKSLNKKDVHGLIIDLRDNGGGIVKAATNMLNTLVPKGVILTEKDKNDRVVNTVRSNGKVIWKKPIVVLVNKDTASSSEIFTGVLKDKKKCIVVGERTYGKGIIQTPFELIDGTIITLTTREYFLPNGESIHKKGIEPHIVIANNSKDKDAQLEKGISVLEGM
ncbi:MAG: S41 family peptidase [Lachnospiraceae bacterium]|nr:S41 family peptidase [Lachnospiraceae bacterium]